MRIGVPKETAVGEQRVALVPDVVAKLTKAGHEVIVEAGAGAGAMLPDAAYAEAGAKIASARSEVIAADVIVAVAPPSLDETAALRADSVLVGFLQPLSNGEGVKALAASGVTSFAMESVPRISRAQSMDALSSQSNVAGYRAALIGAQELGRFYPMLMTAAGTIRPATVLVLGAGVAGLQAIATARRLGSVVQAFDVRAAVKEQVESLGAKFLEFDLGGDLEGEGGYAKELTDEQRLRFFTFWTSNASFPVHEAPDEAYIISPLPAHNAPLFTASTCANHLRVPRYTDKATMLAKMIASLDACGYMGLV